MTSIHKSRVFTDKQVEILNHNRINYEKRNRIIQEMTQEDKILGSIFNWSIFMNEEKVSLKDVIIGEKYMYLLGPGETTGIVTALSDEETYGIIVEFTRDKIQDILFKEESNKKLYKLPLLPRNLREIIKQQYN
jgi:hypothetical protein